MIDRDDTRSATVERTSTASGPPGPELPPTVLLDRYQIGRRLGAGGMGVVYAARDAHLGRAVAIKLVGPRIDPGSGQDRLAREAKAMATLSHPNIATVFDIGLCGDRLFVVMELIDGGTVADWLRAAPRSWREVVGVYLQAARGLAAAHAAGFVHRDFKPENVLLGTDGIARVSDFGVARILDEAERARPAEGIAEEAIASRTGCVGTPGYIAPEILLGQAVDGRADQFSLCVAIHLALYGERPFTRLEGADRMAETLGALRPPRGRIAPRWLQRIVARGLTADPRDRWPTIAAFASAVERRLGRRRRALVVAAVAAVAAAAAVLVAVPRPTPAPPPDWSPIVVGRDPEDQHHFMAVSPDGSTLVTVSPTEAWLEPREGAGPRRRVPLPPAGQPVACRLSRSGDQLFCSFATVGGTFEIWASDVVTGRAERRVPSTGAPTLRPQDQFDVGPDDGVLFAVEGGGAAWSVPRTGTARRVATAGPGDKLVEAVWSPDVARIALNIVSPAGDRIAVLDSATGAIAVVSGRRCEVIGWLTDSSLLCATRQKRNVVLVELLLPAGTGPAQERVRYNGPEYQALDALQTSSAGVLFGAARVDQHLGLLALDAPGPVRRFPSSRISDLFAAGWTPSGALIFGASVQGRLRIMRRLPDGTIDVVRAGPAAEVPLVVLGETIIFGRFPGGESTIPFIDPPRGRRYPEGELFRLAPGGAIAPLGKTRDFVTLYCAGGRAPPCLLAELSGDDVIAIDWDVETGARGPERARWSLTAYGGKSGSLSPDGRTLAQVQRFYGNGELSLLDLASGQRRRVAAPDSHFIFAGWLADGTLVALATTNRGSRIVRVTDASTIETAAIAVQDSDTSTTAGDFLVKGDGTTAAIMMTDWVGTYWWIPRSLE
ncbi:MAG TPA: protein kinase [Kofleriaceae bacterium]|nr:protein kinase [Kofleriaceae bacterium]